MWELKFWGPVCSELGCFLFRMQRVHEICKGSLAGVQWNLRIADTIGTHPFVLCREVNCPLSKVILYRVCIIIWCVLCWEVCPHSECPLSEVSLYNFLEVAWGLTKSFHMYYLR